MMSCGISRSSVRSATLRISIFRQDQRVECDRALALWVDHNGVEIDLADSRRSEQGPAQRRNQLGDRLDIERRGAAPAIEERATLELAQFRRDRLNRKRRGKQPDILQYLGLDAAEADINV